MTRTRRLYERLPGRRILSLGVVHKLFAGPDHVLLLASTSFSETYKRFYYRDIQTVVMRKTRRGAVWNIALGVAAGLFLLLAATRDSGRADWSVLWLFCALPGLLFLVANTLRGPTCVTHLRTAVHLVELPTLGRLRSARKAVALLKPRIAEAQGLLAPEAAPLAVPEAPPDGSSPVPPPVPAAAPPVPDTGRVHEFLFYALLADGIMTIVSFQVRSPWATLLGIPIFIVVTAFLIAAMIRQRARAAHPSLRKALRATMLYWSVNVVIGYALSFAAAMSNPTVAQNQWEFIKYVASIDPTASPLRMSAYLVGIVCPLAIGIAGLVALLRYGTREGRHGPRPAPAAP